MGVSLLQAEGISMLTEPATAPTPAPAAVNLLLPSVASDKAYHLLSFPEAEN